MDPSSTRTGERMKPKWQPIAFPQDCVPYGEQAFQPLVLPEHAVVVAGGPAALFLFRMFEVPILAWRIPARDRIAGFAAHGSELYVQDGPVLSRWSLVDGKCASAINVLVPAQRWTPESSALDWSALHRLPDAQRPRQQALQRARRRAEWAALLEDAEKELAAWSRSPDASSVAPASGQMEQLVADLRALVGPGGAAEARAELARAKSEAAALVISAPVVRAHQISGKGAGMVFVIGRDGSLHPLDDTLTYMGTKRIHRGAQPALALTEFATDADSDEFACRLYYVADDGTVQALDGGALPPAPLPSWSARGAADLEPRLRPRVMDGVLWGAGAQGTGVFALTVDRPAEPSRVKLPAGEWRWLEVRPEASVALASAADRAVLVAFGRGVRMAERWGRRDDVPPCFSTFLPASSAPAPRGRPLLVLEVDREAGSGAELAFRVMVANTVDTAWYPPPPAVLFAGTLQGWGTSGGPAPTTVRTQPSVSRQDAYVIARDRTRSQQLQALAGPDGPGSWQAHYEDIRQRYPDPAAAAAALGEIALPPLAGRDAIYCYAIGSSITAGQAEQAFRALDELREPLRARVYVAVNRQYADGSVTPALLVPFPSARVTLRFGSGRSLEASTDPFGWVLLPGDAAGETVELDPVKEAIRCINIPRVLEPGRDNLVQQTLYIRAR